MKRKIVTAMAVFITLSTVVNTSAAVTFVDINDVPWKGAEVFVARAGELELMVGELINGQRYFRANDNVTCFETLQLIYSVLEKTGNLRETKNIEGKWAYVMEQLGVPKWAYPSTAYALEYGIVSMTEVGKFLNPSNGTQNLASREAVAVMLGKAIVHKYQLDPNAKLVFSDAAAVNDTSIQYIDLLYRLGIVLGDNNNFKPKSPINRAEIATMVTKTYDKLSIINPPNQGVNPNVPSQTLSIPSGTVASISDMGSSYLVTIIKSDGSKIGLFASGSTVVSNLAGGPPNYRALSAGDTIRDVVYIGSDIKTITITYDADLGANQSQNSSIEGVISEIYNDVVYINKSTGGTSKYYLSPNCEYIIDGRTASQKNVFEAYDKGRVDVYVTLNAKGEAIKLDCRPRESDYLYGEIRDIYEKGIRIRKDGSSSTTEYNWVNNNVDDVDFYLEDKSSTYKRVRDAYKDNDTLYVKYITDSKDNIKKVYASKYKFKENDRGNEEIKGTINSITRSYVSVKKTDSSSYRDYDFEDRDVKNATLKIDDKTYDYYDFRDKLDREGTMSVTIYLDKNGKVYKVLAKTRDNSDKETSGVIKSLSSSEIAVGSSSNRYELSGSVTVTSNINGINSLSSLRDHVNDGNILVEADLTLSSNRVTEIKAYIKEVEAELRSFDKRGAVFEVRTKNGIKMKFDFKASAMDVRGDVKNIDDLDYYLNERNRDYNITVRINRSNGYADEIILKEI